MDQMLISFWGGSWHKQLVSFEIVKGVLRETEDNWIDMRNRDGGGIERYDLKRLLAEWPSCATRVGKTWFSGHLRPDQPSSMHQPVPTRMGEA